MADTGKWNGHVFTVKPDVIRSFKDLVIKGGSKTESKDSDKKGYVTRKGANPREVTFTAMLDYRLNVDVRSEAMAFVDEATKGKKAYMYIGGKKLVGCKLMLTDCDVDTIEIAPNNTWIYAECKLSFKQASKGNDGDKKKKKKSTKKGPKGPSPKKPKPNANWIQKLKLEMLRKQRLAKLRLGAKKPSGDNGHDPKKSPKYINLR